MMQQTQHFDYWPPLLTKTITIPETTLYENLQISAKRYPEQIAIEYYGRAMTYRQLIEEVDQLAAYMATHWNLKRGENVMLFMQNAPQYLIALYAILRNRAVVVPINPMSKTHELQFYLQDGDIHHACISQELYPIAEAFVGDGQLENPIIATYRDYIEEERAIGTLPDVVKQERETFPETIAWEDALQEESTLPPYRGESDDVAMIPYTSGTTGEPKGCVHTNRTIQANVVGASYWMSMTSDTVALATLPLFHVTGLVHSGFAPLYAGGTIVLLTRWDKVYAARAIETYRCTNWINISTMVIDFLSQGNIYDYDLSSLLVIGGGGATMPEAVGERLYEVTGRRYVEGYGLSETMSHTHFNPPERPKLQCLGIPAFGVDARVQHVETGEWLGIGEEGELLVHAPQMLIEYYNRPDDDSFVMIDGKRFFKTGDIVKVDEEGYFFMVDRVKRMINASGYKVWPSEVESILFGHPAVRQACVVRSYDEKRGETVKALIILKEEEKGKVTAEELIEWSKQQMSAYKYPREIEFWDEFPMTSSGKVLWRQLQDKIGE